MNGKPLGLYLGLTFLGLSLSISGVWARNITFCGEAVPVNNSFVAAKLMNVIRRQIPYVNLPELRRKANRYFPLIEYCLRKTGMPMDLKYIPVIESGFISNAISSAGAGGMWQLMPETAREWGLQVTESKDERSEFFKSTAAALYEIARNYNLIKAKYHISSWVLTMAAYNYGIGNIYKKISAQGNDYFTMSLNAETAVYVYKLIAVKELFEYPELYMKNFDYNIFSRKPQLENAEQPKSGESDKTEFQEVKVEVKDGEKTAPNENKILNLTEPKEADLNIEVDEIPPATLVNAEIVGKYPDFHDGGSVTIKLQDNLETIGQIVSKGSLVTGTGWIIDNRIHIDLGFKSNTVILFDLDSKQGVPISSLKNKKQVALRVLME